MRKLLIISMLILGIAVHAFCQKKKASYDTLRVLEGIRPPILINDFSRKSDIYFNEEVKRNTNHLIIDFGNKNRLLIDYQGDTKYEQKQNADSLLRNFWNDYSLIRDTVNKNMVKKITYFGKNKNVNRKAIIDIQYFPQKEVFQFGKEVELVRLRQDTLVLVNFDNEATSKLAKTANRVFKTYEEQTFLFNLNAIDNIESILETNINQAIAETAERAETERKSVKPWKILGVENDLMSQRIRSKIKGNALFDYITMHADLGIGLKGLKPSTSVTAAIEFTSSNYFKKGILFGIQNVTSLQNQGINEKVNPTSVFFSGITFYKRKENTRTSLKSGLFLGYSTTSKFDNSASNRYPSVIERNHNLNFFAWYQITPLFRLQIDLAEFEFKRVNANFVTPTYSAKQTSLNMTPSFRISIGF